MIRRLRRAVRALTGTALLAALTGGLAACGGIPAVGPVTEGPRLGESRVGGVILPAGPAPDADPIGIVKGFIQAGGGFAQEHQVARSYLVSSVQTDWRPDAQVTVFKGGSALKFTARTEDGPTSDDEDADRRQPSRAVVVVDVPVVARVDAEGALVNAGPGESLTLRYTLDYTAGLGWRISSLDDGILLSQDDFAFTYRDVRLYFPDRAGEFLVPDVRWFPVSGSMATRAARALLQGPVEWLAPAVSTGVPVGTDLAAKSVQVIQDEGVVDLTATAFEASEEQRHLMLAQFSATLTDLRPSLTTLRITVNQAEFASSSTVLGTSTGPTSIRRAANVSGRPVALDERGRIVRISAAGPEVVAGLTSLNAVNGSRPAVSPVDGSYAVVNPGRSRVYTEQPDPDESEDTTAGRLRPVVQGEHLVRPSFDPQGWVWSASQQGDGRLLTSMPSGLQVPLGVTWLEGGDVRAVRLSRDGSRIAVAVQRDGRGYVFLAPVVRSKAGSPLRVGDAVDLLPDLTDVRDIAWTGEASLVVLGTRGGSRQPWELLVGGQPSSTLEIDDGRTLAATQAVTNGPVDLYVGTDDGRVLKLEGQRWVEAAVATWPSMPG